MKVFLIKQTKIMYLLLCMMCYTFVSSSLFALPSVVVYKLDSKDVPLSMSHIVNDLIFSFVNELKGYKVNDLHVDLFPKDDNAIPLCDYVF